MPIVVPKEEWARILKWTDEDKTDPETLRRREYIRYLNDTSRAMTKNWPNSLENVNKRNEQIRKARIDAAERVNTKFYKRFVRRQKEEKARLMYSARDTIFKNKDAPKLLLSAVIETVIQKERSEQVKFNKERQKEAAIQKRKDDDDIMRRAKEWNELLETRKKRRFEVNKKHQKDIVDQAHEIEERKRLEYEEELKMQRADNQKANEEMEALREFDIKYRADEKAQIWRDMERAKKEHRQRKDELAALELMDDKLVTVLLNSRARIERKRLKTEKEIRAEKLRILEKISHKLESGDAARDAKEQANLEKAIKEKHAIEDERHNAKQRKLANFKQDRIDSRNKFLRDEAQRNHEKHTMLQWEAMNRLKNQEIYEDFKENLRKEKERKIKEHRAEILRLWKERKDRDDKELADTRYFYGELALQKLRDADNKLLTHAAALLEEARANGRPEHALHKAIDRYCKLYRLYPMPDLPKSMKEHFKKYAPWDGSKADPWYVEPAPPPKPRQSDEMEDAPLIETSGKKDGLQEVKAVPGPSKPQKKQQEESVEDYKRAGRADGLQRRHAAIDITLPPVNVNPSTATTCNCNAKK